MGAARGIAALSLLALLGCEGVVIVGEQQRPGDEGLGRDADRLPDAAPDAAPDATPDAEPDAEPDAAPPLSCQAVLDCLGPCGADMRCAVGCSEGICAESAAPYEALERCALEACPAQCAHLGSQACAGCMMGACALEGAACLSAGCAP